MLTRILAHTFFWFLFVMLYVVTKMLFAPESMLEYSTLERFRRYFLGELAIFPWKIILFYFLFYYLVPRFFRKGKYIQFSIYFLLALIACLFGHRSFVVPVSNLVFNESPTFNVYSLKRFLYTLTDILPAIGLAASVKLLKGSIIAQKKEQALKQEKLESELNFLKAQTNPHFLFNTLNNLYGLARKNDKNTAPSIMKLSNIMRYILYECSTPTIPIENEVKIIEDYIQLEQLRYDERLKIQFKKSIENWQQPVAPLILLHFVENAFKHGASETRFDAFIDIELVQEGNQLRYIINNARDEEDDPEPSAGIGLNNVKRQLDLVYGNRYSLDIQSEPSIFSIALTIDLEEHDGRKQEIKLPDHRG